MRINAIIIRIVRQFIRDKRTLALIFLAPLLILTMLHLVFNGETYYPKIGVVNLPDQMKEIFPEDDAEITYYDREEDADEALHEQQLDGYLLFEGQTPAVYLEGSDPSINGATLKWISGSLAAMQPPANTVDPEVHYLHGSEDMGQFDYFGSVLLGFFAFFFVFLIAGISFLRERTTNTLERLLASPLKRWEIVIGYVLGFGIFAVLQASVITAYAVYVLDMLMEGSFFYVLLVIIMLALTALTFGTLLSAFANNELQMMQFIPLVIVPQIFFSGLFNLETISDWLSWIGPFTPLYYGAHALQNIMVRGDGWSDIYVDILVLAGFSLLFIILNIVTLKKYRKI
ncbi:ABC transporter permease [Bacillaceae bacterium Marseille-Q3522]|nr:ABC transporter permease [Bacillaceae bacterium Marseille-Q3522]